MGHHRRQNAVLPANRLSLKSNEEHRFLRAFLSGLSVSFGAGVGLAGLGTTHRTTHWPTGVGVHPVYCF